MLFSLMPITVDAHTSARLSKVLINALSAMLSAIFVCSVSCVSGTLSQHADVAWTVFVCLISHFDPR